MSGAGAKLSRNNPQDRPHISIKILHLDLYDWGYHNSHSSEDRSLTVRNRPATRRFFGLTLACERGFLIPGSMNSHVPSSPKFATCLNFMTHSSLTTLPDIVDRVNTSSRFFYGRSRLNNPCPIGNGSAEIELKSGFCRFFVLLPQVRIPRPGTDLTII